VTQFFPSLIVAAGVFAVLAVTALRTEWGRTGRPPAPTTTEIGEASSSPSAPVRGRFHPASGGADRGSLSSARERRMIGLTALSVGTSAALFSLGLLGILTRRNAG